MAKSKERLRAIELRNQGYSIKEIAVILAVSKSSVSYWCREIVLKPEYQIALKKRSLEKNSKGRLIGARMNKEKRLHTIEKFKIAGTSQINNINARDLLLIGTALYWAEGSKSDSRFIFVNSSPDMVQIIYDFLLYSCGVKKEDIRIGIQINRIHLYRINKVLSFWSELLKLPTSQFDKPYYINTPPKKVYENMETYYGTVRLKVRKSANLQYRILGLIDAVVKSKRNMSR